MRQLGHETALEIRRSENWRNAKAAAGTFKCNWRLAKTDYSAALTFNFVMVTSIGVAVGCPMPSSLLQLNQRSSHGLVQRLDKAPPITMNGVIEALHIYDDNR